MGAFRRILKSTEGPLRNYTNLKLGLCFIFSREKKKWFLSKLLICQVMKTCNTTEGSAQQPGKPGICELTEFKTNSKIFTRPPDQQLRGYPIFKLCNWISSRKQKRFEKPFLPVHMGPRSNLLSKKCSKISWPPVPLNNGNDRVTKYNKFSMINQTDRIWSKKID